VRRAKSSRRDGGANFPIRAVIKEILFDRVQENSDIVLIDREPGGSRKLPIYRLMET